MKLMTWVVERLLEVAIATLIVMAIARPSQGVGGGGIIEEFYRTAGIPLMFYIFSGYLASCIYFGFVARSSTNKYLPLIMGAAFVVHFGAFLLFSSSGFETQVALSGALALLAVIVIHWLGSRFLLGRLSEPH